MTSDENQETASVEEDDAGGVDEESDEGASLVDIDGSMLSDNSENEEKSDEEESDDGEVEDGDRDIPELNDNIYRSPFSGYNTSDPEEIAEAIGEIDSEAEKTIKLVIEERNEIKQASEKYKQKLSEKTKEFRQYKKRKDDETEELKETASKTVVKKMLPIRDNLSRALRQDDSEDIYEGVKLVRNEFDKLLESQGIKVIHPVEGDEVNPEYHQVMSRVESDVEEGKITSCYLPGFVMNEVVVREAKVNVSGSAADE